MSLVPPRDRSFARAASLSALFLAVTNSACTSVAPGIADARGGSNTATRYGAQAFTAQVNTRSRSLTIAAPASTARVAALPVTDESVSLSLLGSDVIRLVPSNLQLSRVGEFAPGLVRVSFDVTMESRIPSLTFVTASWPTPPADYVVLFPLDYAVLAAPGGASGDDANGITVGLPGRGRVAPSDAWNGTGFPGSGAPYDFFHEATCGVPGADCFRWVAFDTPRQTGARAHTRTVGFDIDASVAQFSARMIVVADLAPIAAVAP